MASWADDHNLPAPVYRIRCAGSTAYADTMPNALGAAGQLQNDAGAARGLQGQQHLHATIDRNPDYTPEEVTP